MKVNPETAGSGSMPESKTEPKMTFKLQSYKHNASSSQHPCKSNQTIGILSIEIIWLTTITNQTQTPFLPCRSSPPDPLRRLDRTKRRNTRRPRQTPRRGRRLLRRTRAARGSANGGRVRCRGGGDPARRRAAGGLGLRLGWRSRRGGRGGSIRVEREVPTYVVAVRITFAIVLVRTSFRTIRTLDPLVRAIRFLPITDAPRIRIRTRPPDSLGSLRRPRSHGRLQGPILFLFSVLDILFLCLLRLGSSLDDRIIGGDRHQTFFVRRDEVVAFCLAPCDFSLGLQDLGEPGFPAAG